MSDDLYAHGYEKWEKRYSEMSSIRFALGDNPTLEVEQGVHWYRQLNAEKPAHALDLGCGDGRNTLFLAQHHFTVTAVDASAAGLARLVENLEAHDLADRVTAVESDLRTFDPPEVDLLVASYVIHMLPEPYTFLRSWQAKTRPGGLCAISTRGRMPHDPELYWFPERFELKHIFMADGWQILHVHEHEEYRESINGLFYRRGIVARKPEIT